MIIGRGNGYFDKVLNAVNLKPMMAEKAHTGIAAMRWTMRRCDGR